MTRNVNEKLHDRIVGMFMVKDANELWHSNPRFVRICKGVRLSHEEALALDARRIEESLDSRVVVAQRRNRDKINNLWADYKDSKHGQISYAEYLMLMVDPQLPRLDDDADLEAKATRLKQYMQVYLCYQHNSGVTGSPIDFRQLGASVGIDNPEQVSRIINPWLDERKWLDLVEAGIPNPKKGKAHCYALLDPDGTCDTLKNS